VTDTLPVALRSNRRLDLGPALPAILTVVSVASIVLLGALRILDGPPALNVIAQVTLLVAFSALAFVDYRAAVAIVLIEIACLGASGLWTSLPGGLTGRQALHAIVLVRALAMLFAGWRAGRRIQLGRYGWHALALAVILPLIWMPLGLLNGNLPNDVFGDGNAHLFFAFILVFIALIAEGFGPWLRRWLLIACAVNAVVTGLLIAATLTNLVPLGDLAPIVTTDLVMGGAVGYMPNGAYRLYLGSGLYLQVGVALTIWYLLQKPRDPWLWALYALLLFATTATYTRGFWLGTALAAAIVLLVAAQSLRRPAAIVAGTIVIFIASSAVGTLASFSVPAYIFDRTASSLAIGDDGLTGPDESPPPLEEDFQGDVAGATSNRVKLAQARVLIGHIVESPVIGHGFGSIAEDYPYAQIYSYELAFLDLAYKTGIIGLVLFLTLPLRFVYDAFRIRFDVLRPPRQPTGISRHEMSVVLAIVISVLITSATNPYILASFGMLPVLICVAWLDPLEP
jgi:O-Antigen ligase